MSSHPTIFLVNYLLCTQVHCSAGVGRSGTYITLDYLLKEIESGNIKADEAEDPVYETVNTLREQRMFMVQSEPQYHFIYDVLKEKFVKDRKSVNPPAGRRPPTLEDMVDEANGDANGDAR